MSSFEHTESARANRFATFDLGETKAGTEEVSVPYSWCSLLCTDDSNRLSSTAVLTWSRPCAPDLVQLICCFLQKRQDDSQQCQPSAFPALTIPDMHVCLYRQPEVLEAMWLGLQGSLPASSRS
jgi:hypothetical protein